MNLRKLRNYGAMKFTKLNKIELYQLLKIIKCQILSNYIKHTKIDDVMRSEIFAFFPNTS